MNNEPEWLQEHRENQDYSRFSAPYFTTGRIEPDDLSSVAETAFNNHQRNTGEHVSPFDTGRVRVGTEGLEVRLLQGIDFASLKQVVARGVRATIGNPRPPQDGSLMSPPIEVSDEAWREMFRGGLQAQLESQVITFEVWGASRILTHQLVRSTRARFSQQSQRSTWYGDRPEVRMPETVWRAGYEVRRTWTEAYESAWTAYKEACDAGIPYEDARYILPEGTVNYIVCSYSIREFMAVYAYRGCSMFLREMVEVMRGMRTALLSQAPWMEEFVRVSCENGPGCASCGGTGKFSYSNPTLDGGTWVEGIPEGSDCPICDGLGGARKCTFQGWENVELACDKPQAKESNRVFLAAPRLRIASKS